MELELVKGLLGQGGATAVCLLLVFWFLKDKRETNEVFATKLEGMVDRLASNFSTELTAARSQFATEMTTARAAFQGQISEFSNQIFNVSINTSATLSKLSESIDELRDEMRSKIEKSH